MASNFFDDYITLMTLINTKLFLISDFLAASLKVNKN